MLSLQTSCSTTRKSREKDAAVSVVSGDDDQALDSGLWSLVSGLWTLDSEPAAQTALY